MILPNNLKENTIYLKKKDEVYLQVFAVDSILENISNFFSFYANGYQFQPKFKMKLWDGKIRLFNKRTCELYFGLLPHIKEYARLHEYIVEYVEEDLDIEDEYSVSEAQEFIQSLKLHANHDGGFVPIKAYDYQVNAFRQAVQTKRSILLSPTSSGKSLIIYGLARYYQPKIKGKILIVVPNVSLVTQLYNDFGEYSYDDKWDVRDEVFKIYEGQDKNADYQIYISTWQSIYKLGEHYFEQFSVILADEVHGAKANCMTSLLNKCVNAKYRIGTTGTLDGTNVNKITLEGLFGKVHRVTTTAQLISDGTVSDIQINCLTLHYPEDIRKKMKKAEYQDEIDFLIHYEARNKFIRNLAISLKGNTLLLFRYVKEHGIPLYESIKLKAGDTRKVFYISGKTEIEERDEVKRITEQEDNAIIVASVQVFGVGINIRKLHNVIFGSPMASRITILQSLGRGLRKAANKTLFTLFDISDDLSTKSWTNHSLKHFLKRISIYNSEKFPNKMFKILLK